jgi:hypothetical protein
MTSEQVATILVQAGIALLIVAITAFINIRIKFAKRQMKLKRPQLGFFLGAHCSHRSGIAISACS